MRENLVEAFNAAVENALDHDARIIILDARSFVELLVAKPGFLDDLPNDLDIDPSMIEARYGFTYRTVSIFYDD